MSPIFRLFEAWIDPFMEPPAKDMPSSGLRYLLFFVSQVKWPFVLLLVFGGATAFVEVAIANFLGTIIDMLEESGREALFENHGWTLFWMAFVVIVLRTCVNAVITLTEELSIIPGFYQLVRWQGHQRVMKQSLSYFQNDLAGRLSQKVMQSGFSAGELMSNLLQVVWYITVYAVTALVLVSELDIRLGALVALWLLCFSLIAWLFLPRVRGAAKDFSHAISGVSGRLVDTYTNIQSVKLFGSLEEESRGAKNAFRTLIGKILVFSRLISSVRILMNATNGIMTVAIAGTALMVWREGTISTGHVAFALTLVLRLNILLTRLFGQLNGLFRGFGSLQDSVETIVKPIELSDAPAAPELTVPRGAIRFEDVRFHYGRDEGVIDQLDLVVAPGERVGIVGPSGAGKTTLVSLLLRFFDVEGGRILIDGQDIRDVTQESLRRSIGMVTQDTSLLHRSIRENIKYGRMSASEEELLEATRQAHAYDFIRSLEDRRGRSGFEAFVGERGVKLSGGQRQRIAIARVLLKDAPILVLDEATSALDSEVEAAIQDNLQGLMTGKTVIAIAHRLSTIAAMDRLIVMDKGTIVQEGKHEELLKDETGLYAQLWQRQSGGFLKVEPVTA